MKTLVKKLAPQFVIGLVRRLRARKFSKMGRGELFDFIYGNEVWGNADGVRSGQGSADPSIVDPYVNVVRAFLRSLDPPVSVVDIGCGDFRVGSRLCGAVDRYIACDVSAMIIEANKRDFDLPNVEFRRLDACEEQPLAGDVAIIRQVLQHLGNDEIARLLKNAAHFTWLVVAEHIPSGPFTPNLDKKTGPDVRTKLGSGVDVEQPPFDLNFTEKRILCETPVGPDEDSIIRTTLYRLS